MMVSAATWNQPASRRIAIGDTRPTSRLLAKLPAAKPLTEISTISPNSRGEKPSLSCRMKGVPASMPKLMAKAKPRVST